MRAAAVAPMDAFLLQVGVPADGVSYEAMSAISFFATWLFGTIVLLGLAGIAAWLIPDAVAERVYRSARDETSRSIALGLVVAIGVPLSIVAFTLSVLLLPLGLATVMLGAALAAAGYVTSGWLVGRALSARLEPALDLRARVTWTLIGVAVLRVLSLVPGVDLLIAVVATTLGVGALLATFDRTGSFRRRAAERAPVRQPATYPRPAHERPTHA